MKRRLVFFSAGFAAAVFSLQFLRAEPWMIVLLFLIAAGMAALASLKGEALSALFLAVGILLGGIWNCVYTAHDVHLPYNIGEEYVQAAMTARDYSYPTASGDRMTFTADVFILDGERLKRPVRAVVYSPQGGIKPGDVISTAYAAVEVPENTEAFAAYTYYKTRGIDARVYIPSDSTVIPCDRVGVRYIPQTLRREVLTRIRALTDGECAAFLSALIIGDKSGLSDALEEELRITGLSHTVAISGMHVSFLVGLIILMFGRRRAVLAAIPVMLLFVAVAGGTPSVIRAFVMQCFVLCAPLFMREADSLTSLFAALLVILAINPYAIGDVGLQLSFTAALGIILFSGGIKTAICSKFTGKKKSLAGRLVDSFSSAASATVSATAMSVPILVYYFGRVSLISVAANVLVIWLVSLLFSAGVAVVALDFLWKWAAVILAPVLEWLVRVLLGAVHTLSEVPYASVYAKDAWVICGVAVIYAGGIITAVYRRKEIEHWMRPIVLSAAMGAVLIGIGAYTPPVPYGADITVFDVGQGLCVMAECADGRVVIDCGGDSEINPGDRVYDAIMLKNTRDIDALVLSHSHRDHINGAKLLLSKARVKDLYTLSDSGALPDMQEIIETALSRGTRVHLLDEDEEIRLGDMSVGLYVYRGEENENDTGIASEVRVGEFGMVMTGDFSEKAEEDLVGRGVFGDADVCIVGHHGAENACGDALLDAVRPEHAIISVSANNSYGHPAKETVLRLAMRAIHTRCTDDVGDIRFNSEVLLGNKE